MQFNLVMWRLFYDLMTTKSGKQSGFGLVEVLMAFGLTSVLVLALMKMMDLQTKQGKTAALNNEVLNIQRLFQTTITDDIACFSTFGGIAPNDEIIPAIKVTSDLTKKPFAESGEVFGQSGITIKEMKLLSPASALAAGLIKNDSYFCKDNEGICTVWFKVTIEKNGKIYGGKDKTFYNFLKGRFAEVKMISDCSQEEAVEACRTVAQASGSSFKVEPEVETDPSGELVRNDCPANKGRIIQCSVYSDSQPLVECLN